MLLYIYIHIQLKVYLHSTCISAYFLKNYIKAPSIHCSKQAFSSAIDARPEPLQACVKF